MLHPSNNRGILCYSKLEETVHEAYEVVGINETDPDTSEECKKVAAKTVELYVGK